MTRTLLVLFMLAFVSLFLFPDLVDAVDLIPEPEPEPIVEECYLYHDFTFIHEDCEEGETVPFEERGMCCILNIVYNITTLAFYGILALVIAFVLLGAYFLAAAGGDPEKMTKGRKFIIWGVVAFAIGLSVFALPRLAVRIFFPVG